MLTKCNTPVENEQVVFKEDYNEFVELIKSFNTLEKLAVLDILRGTGILFSTELAPHLKRGNS